MLVFQAFFLSGRKIDILSQIFISTYGAKRVCVAVYAKSLCSFLLRCVVQFEGNYIN